VPSVASEVSAVRHAHQGQGPRSSAQSADSADQTSPFAALLEGTSDSAPAPKAPAPAAPPPPSQKPAARPNDGQSASAEASPSTQKPPSGSPAPAQAGGVASSPPGPKGNDVTQTALGALAKKAAKDGKSDSDAADALPLGNSAAAVANAADATAGSSTAAAVTDSHGDKTEKSDSSATDAAPAAPPPVDPSANQAIPVVPLPVAMVVSPPLIPDVAAPNGNDSKNVSKSGAASGPDAAQIAALSDAVAGAPRGKTDRAAAEPKNGAPTAGTPQTGGNAATGAKAAEVARSTPSLMPQPSQKEPGLPSGPSQPIAADAAQSRNADGLAAKAASTRQRVAANPSTDSSAGPQDNSSDNANVGSNGNSNADPKQDGAATATQIADIAQQALDKTARHVEAPATDTAKGGILHPETVLADGTQPSPDGASGLIAPATLSTAAAPAAAAAATITTATAVPITGLAVEIAAHAQAGKNRFEIRLDPPELGRINVRLEVDHDGKVTSHLVADRQETLDMLRRDAPALERSLQDAGLKTGDNALQFSLRDQGAFGGQNQNPNHGSPADAARVVIPDRELPAVEATTAAYGRLAGTSLGIDIRV
jgi:flagellar hook-length control protein FliK